ncbi:MAG TPA: hypothetical protein VM656_09520, partial [Pyrinomonadaceae bacterium]|nr:hypothetical protein [Pyrinomonadaceae bacterium]
VGDTFADISKALKTLRDPKMWLRIGMFLTGAFLTWLAIWQLTGDNQMGNVRKTIIKVGGALVTKKVK